MESVIIDGINEIADFQFALLGLDGTEDPELGYTVDRAFQLTMEKIRGAKAYPQEVRFKVWLDDISKLERT